MLVEYAMVWLMLAAAALLEAGGDALIRLGLRGGKIWLLWGSMALVAYGFLVNLARWEKGSEDPVLGGTPGAMSWHPFIRVWYRKSA